MARSVGSGFTSVQNTPAAISVATEAATIENPSGATEMPR